MADWYCDFTNGDDTTGDGSAGLPFKTIQKALNTLSTAVYNTVHVMADEQLASALIMPTTTDGMIITGSSALSVPVITAGAGQAVSTQSGIYTRFHQLKLVNNAAWAFNVNTAKFIDCEIVIAGGMTVNGNSTIEGCYIHGTGGTFGVSATAGARIFHSVVDVAFNVLL
jgi:hypothetical protein